MSVPKPRTAPQSKSRGSIEGSMPHGPVTQQAPTGQRGRADPEVVQFAGSCGIPVVALILMFLTGTPGGFTLGLQVIATSGVLGPPLTVAVMKLLKMPVKKLHLTVYLIINIVAVLGTFVFVVAMATAGLG